MNPHKRQVMTDPGSPANRGSCISCPVYQSGFLSKISPEALATIQAERRVILYKKRQVVFYEGTPCAALYCLKSGLAKLVKSDAKGERRKIVRLIGQGELLGYRALVANESYHATAETVVDSEICVIPLRCLGNVMAEPGALEWMVRKLSSDLREAEDMERDLVIKNAHERLVDLLISLGEINGHGPSVNGDQPGFSKRIHVVLTREEMAEVIGTTAETVVRILSEFQEKGLVIFQSHDILVKNFEAFRALAPCR